MSIVRYIGDKKDIKPVPSEHGMLPGGNSTELKYKIAPLNFRTLRTLESGMSEIYKSPIYYRRSVDRKSDPVAIEIAEIKNRDEKYITILVRLLDWYFGRDITLRQGEETLITIVDHASLPLNPFGPEIFVDRQKVPSHVLLQ